MFVFCSILNVCQFLLSLYVGKEVTGIYSMWSFLQENSATGLFYNSLLLLQSFLGPNDCTHSPKDRACWKDGFNINTDYEYEIPKGKLVEVLTT